jgi:hypothetical protein
VFYSFYFRFSRHRAVRLALLAESSRQCSSRPGHIRLTRSVARQPIYINGAG